VFRRALPLFPGGESPKLDFSERERHLTDALETARAEYESTKKQFELAMENKLGGAVKRSDGNSSLKQIAQTHSDAMRNYRAALVEFNRFVFDKGMVLDGATKEAQLRRAKPQT